MSTTQSTLSRELPLAPVTRHTWQIKIKAQWGRGMMWLESIQWFG